MAFYYISDSATLVGTATGNAGRSATPRTGSFADMGAAALYANAAAAYAATTPPVAGQDILIFADDHDQSGTGNTLIPVQTGDVNIEYVARDATNVANYRRSGQRAKITATSGGDIQIAGVTLRGFELEADDDIIFGATNTGRTYDCICRITGNGDQIRGGGDRSCGDAYDTEFQLNHAGASFALSNNFSFAMRGGAITTTSAGISSLIQFANNGGFTAEFYDVPMQSVTGTLLDVDASSSTADTFLLVMDRCRLASGVNISQTDMATSGQIVRMTRCGSSGNESEYGLNLRDFNGNVDADDVIRRDDDAAFADTNVKISYKIVTTANCDTGNELVFQMPIGQGVDLGSTSTLRFYLASTTTLTDAEFYIVVRYPDGSTRAQVNVVSSAAGPSHTPMLDPLATGTALTNDTTSDWRNGAGALTGYNEYQIDIDTSGDAGADCVPSVEIHVAKASTTIQLAANYTAS